MMHATLHCNLGARPDSIDQRLVVGCAYRGDSSPAASSTRDSKSSIIGAGFAFGVYPAAPYATMVDYVVADLS